MMEFVPRLSRIYHSLLSRKFLSSFPTMAVLCSLQIHSKLNGYQLTSTGGDLDRQLTYRELSFGKDPHQLLTTYACVAVFSDCLRWLRISTFQERSRNFPEPAVQTSHYGENVSDCVSDSYKPQIGKVIMFLIVFPFISYKLAMS